MARRRQWTKRLATLRRAIGQRRRILCAAGVLFAIASTGETHERWANGLIVPAWVKSMCCGANDVHMDPELNHTEAGWSVPDNDFIVPDSKVLPSQDGHTWVFYNDSLRPNATIYCLFMPQVTLR